MDNLFDSSNYPDQEPTELVAGVLWGWTASDITAAYPTASYTLKYRLSEQDNPNSQWAITAGKVSSAHVVEESHTDTRAYPPGVYQWRAVIVRDSDGEEVEARSGFLTVKPSLDAAGTTSSWVYRVLEAIRATIEGTASEKQSSYSIGGRALSLRSFDELLVLEREFSRRWKSEQDDALRKAGQTVKSRVLVKMSA